MTFRPVRLAGLALSGALFAAPAFAQTPEQAPAGEPVPLIQPQLWPQCLVELELAQDDPTAPENSAELAQQFRASLDKLAAANGATQEEVEEVLVQLREAMVEQPMSALVQDAHTCASGAPHPDMFEIQEGAPPAPQ